MKKKILVITEKHSDLLDILKENNLNLVVLSPGQIYLDNLDEFYSICILGGSFKEPIMLEARERQLVEEQINKGKRVFTEYCGSIAGVYYDLPYSTRYERLVFCSKEDVIEGIGIGDILDDQCGMRLKPYVGTCSSSTPILQFANVHTHKRLEDVDNICDNIPNRALWFEKENLLICSFKLSNFIKARYSPENKMRSLVKYILDWVTEWDISLKSVKPYYTIRGFMGKENLKEHIKNSVKEAMHWFRKAEMLVDEGRGGVYEGFGTEIYEDGTQRFSKLIRADCSGEVSLAYFMDYILTGNKESLSISDNILDFCFKYMQCKEKNHLYGMVRWTNQAWEICYQDDVARAIIPALLKCLYTGNDTYLEQCIEALNFLVKTTGKDGNRVFRTVNEELTEEKIKELKETPGNLPSAHYNAYYHAALLLAYKLTGIEEFKDVAVTGLSTIMKLYPDTLREQSQTEEYCRLILPLSWLYWVTKEEMHKDWLYKVTEDLQKFKHKSGAYLEWDEGYKASMRNTEGSGECSLLSANGDTVVDLLYSNNWLPIGLIQAYMITEDTYFKDLWEENTMFIMSAQIQSEDANINGAWARGFDVDYMEYFGSNADIGWGPWAIESGWTVAEIAAGLIMGLVEDKIKVFHK